MSGPGSLARPWLIALAYLPLAGLLVLLVSRDREARWHARNGLLLFAMFAAAASAATLVGILVPALTCLYAVAMGIGVLLYLSIAILATVKAFEGQRLMIPAISTHATRLSARD